MATLGSYLLLAAFVVAAYAAAMSVAGARRRSTAPIESGVGAFYLVAAIMSAASAIIVHAFVAGDYTIRYVQEASDSVQPLFYKLTAYWGGLDGSIMFWVFMLSLFGSAAVYANRERQRELIPYVVATISVVQMFFLFLMVVHNNPFSTFLTRARPKAGAEPAAPELLHGDPSADHVPGLRRPHHSLRVRHGGAHHRPPRRLVAARHAPLDDDRVAVPHDRPRCSACSGPTKSWAGAGTGCWDPVENARPLPWFTATAFLHSVMVQERRGMLRVWNVSLVITTFFLTIFGTFLTRSGVVQSVHAFGEDPRAGVDVHRVHGDDAGRQLWLRDLPAAAAEAPATSWTRGCRARRRSWPTTGSCCSARSSSCSPRCSRR